MNAVLRRRLITSVAVLGWAGLGIQLYLIFFARLSVGASLLGGLVSFFSYFTVLTNTLVAVVLTCAVTDRESTARRWFLQPWVSSGIAVSIAVVGLAYSILLRHLWHPQGWQFIADELLHDVMPLLFLAYWWLCVPKGSLRLKHLPLWLIYPLVYFAYALLRGHLLGAYAYPFIDVALLGYPQVFINAGGILLGFVLMALLVIGIDRWQGRRL
ncbi:MULTISPECIES: Pr6Pr family membrane protein [Pseudomonas]|uniref:Putative membrane protein n=1 Tax=Pseudomonas fluorescens (strain Pf0-1) TaxID=205922 RepID=Q3K7E3_PSEPF|nr:MULTISPECIES: Pr6Pr family membrane protein [Pseudomonas]ABA76311.1 putative membrane protein [Pseudomonas fluorescens Pf0-1]MBL0794169.1 Pr6Pr family membrane protein [Pseudomonas sp. B7]MBX8623050.1 Pr6Pr family membrane protein [Pseudomonas glycinae]MBY9024239.1 Pr6Pr family membrane protein [Pseudomonas fluorescens]MBY9030552.1 Pr6Pr family membrane protein [Pseudomonas fluorescens]